MTLIDQLKETVSETVSKVAHSEVAEKLATGARHALEKVVEVAETAAEHLPGGHAKAAEASADAKASATPSAEETSSRIASAGGNQGRPQRAQASARPVAAVRQPEAKAMFKVKRGQKH